VSLFAAAGFEIIEPIRAPKRRVMRKVLQAANQSSSE
jgi:hypothetical protein